MKIAQRPPEEVSKTPFWQNPSTGWRPRHRRAGHRPGVVIARPALTIPRYRRVTTVMAVLPVLPPCPCQTMVPVTAQGLKIDSPLTGGSSLSARGVGIPHLRLPCRRLMSWIGTRTLSRAGALVVVSPRRRPHRHHLPAKASPYQTRNR